MILYSLSHSLKITVLKKKIEQNGPNLNFEEQNNTNHYYNSALEPKKQK